jgi:hypothetical protein
MLLMPHTYYLTRNGQKAYIDAIASENPFTGEVPAHPAIGYYGPASFSWRADGSVSDTESEYDIVSLFEDYVTEVWYGLEDIDSGEQSEERYASHRAAFDACAPGWQVIEMLKVMKVLPKSSIDNVA